ncbi:DNA/RNA polymerase, partial [Exidia glandulosa HHB12029]
LGGFLLNDIEYSLPLIIKNSELKEQSIINDVNIIFDTVNNLSSVAYKINTDVLEFILEKGIEYDLIIDPDFKHPIEIKKNNHQKLTISENKSLDSFLSKKQLEMNILGLALIFKNVPEFYIPVRLDNRGRIYCMVDYLNYQGLVFSKGEKIYKYDKQSIDYLKIFGGNCFGNGIDKKSYNERVEWVNNNEEDILNFRNGNLIKKADSKLLFIAFCFEYINYHNSLFSNETSYISHFPIQLDATCNGYQ